MRIPRIFGAFVCCLASSLNAAEGGYSNYLPGSYGDFAAAVEPATDLTIRNDLYRYQVDNRMGGDHIYLSFAMGF